MGLVSFLRSPESLTPPESTRLTASATRPSRVRPSLSIHPVGYVIVRSAMRRGGRKRPNPKGIVYGKPKHQGINQLKAVRNLRAIAEERVGRRFTNLRVLGSYWINQVCRSAWRRVRRMPPTSTTRSFLSILLTMPSETIPRSTGSATPLTSTVSSVVSPPLVATTVVCSREVTSPTSALVAPGELPGREETLSPSDATDKRSTPVLLCNLWLHCMLELSFSNIWLQSLFCSLSNTQRCELAEMLLCPCFCVFMQIFRCRAFPLLCMLLPQTPISPSSLEGRLVLVSIRIIITIIAPFLGRTVFFLNVSS